jgi:hypothetical protein
LSSSVGTPHLKTETIVECVYVLGRTQGDMSPLKKPVKCLQCTQIERNLSVYLSLFTSASLLEVVHFCRYVFHLINKTQSYGVRLCNKFIILKFMVTKFICNKDYMLQKLYIKKIFT